MDKTGINNIRNDDLVYFGERIEPYFASSIIIRGMLDSRNLRNIIQWDKGVRWMYANDYFFNIGSDLMYAQSELKIKFKENGRQYARSLVKRCIKYGNDFINISKKIQKESGKGRLSKEKMHDLLKEYIKAASNYMIFQNIALFEGPVADITRELTKRYSRNEKKSAILASLMTTSDNLTSAEKEMDDFLLLCIKREGKDKLLDRHAKRYGWLSLRFFVGEPWTERYLQKRAEGFSAKKAKAELLKRQQNRKDIEKKINKAVKNFSKEDKKSVQLIRSIVYLRTQRTDFFQESSYYALPLVKKIAEALGISYSDLMYLGGKEVLLSLQGKFDFHNAIKRRKQGFLVFFDFDKDIILESDDVLRYVAKRPILDRKAGSVRELKEIVGNVAYPGHAKGRVMIVKTEKDNPKFAKGDILVSIMTTPNLTPSMNKAAAIITDEGGITCHAAIFAREMKKPCIIGTHIATKALKDGDTIEVDADKGVVRVLKRVITS